jgi:plastocyanin
VAAQLDLVIPGTTPAAACSSATRVRLLDACGAPVVAASAIPLTFTPGSTTLQLYNDTQCSFQPSGWAIGAGASEVDVYFLEPNPGMPTLRVDSAGLDGSVKTLTIACPTGQRPCANGGCVDNAGCCGDMDCDDGGVQYVCNTSQRCEPPPCTFPANCTTYDDRTASGASRTITFDSNGYSPKCMRVTTSQDVTFSGSFFLHPLQQFCGPRDVNMTATSGNSKTVRFPDFGTYGFRCKNHPVFEQGGIRTP